ncbi:transforming growth factor-beta-induced protein [Cyclonatronum proteinivorum]|uniref:Transforming growth factor-beta-induced protein n=1 Tax=Cyclonatronum proteinivorum TaxID=1457365 RepID=A0A345UPK0_9BACT|nr:fasciclin domain-containing protein [Cyclonatronum proteinivorum]AXJ02402.1 transforming growth factor-beta-induced protein [Cyclonatronum proteinivorum]
MSKIKILILVIAFGLFLKACGADDQTPAADTTADAVEPSIVEIAVANEEFSTLVSALQSAELVAALEGEGPFTVFAPTNDAFAAIAEVVETLTPEQLTNVLLYHVLDTRVLSGDITDGIEVPTLLEGQNLTVNVVDGNVVINGNATVIAADVEGRNGVIHVIDAVLVPEL